MTSREAPPDGTVRVWESSGGECLHALRGHTDIVWSVALSENGELAVSGGADGTVRLWEISSGACLRILRGSRDYEGLDITGLSGITAAQREVLLTLGAVDGTPR
jgi:WD40 repeat protein